MLLSGERPAHSAARSRKRLSVRHYRRGKLLRYGVHARAVLTRSPAPHDKTHSDDLRMSILQGLSPSRKSVDAA